jgi:light-harvesting complex I chlorophyll a/b binding protein 1
LRWPGYLSTSENIKFSDLPNGILGFKAIPVIGLAQIFLFIGLMEAFTWPFLVGGKVPEGKLPGDVAGDMWVRYSDPEVKAKKLNVELNNGRAAMMGITGMLMHDHLLGTWVPPGF